MPLALLQCVRQRLIILTVATGFLGCTAETDEHGLTLPTRLCREGVPVQPCRGADDVEALLQRDDLEIVSVKKTSEGVQGARILTLRSGGWRPVVFRAKWRAHDTTTRRNSPRFELAAYAVQKLFLTPSEYAVPPTAAQCFPIDAYRAKVDRDAKPTFPGSQCVYGVLSYWLEDVTSIADAQRAGWFDGRHDHVFDPRLYSRDRVYRDSLARMNVVTYVISHDDSHARNFVIARSSTKPPTHFVYSVDNSLSFTMHKNPRIRPQIDWSAIRVNALPRATIDRLRAALDRLSSLETIAVISRDKLRENIGLTPIEIDGVRARIEALLARVDRGELRTY